MKINKNSYVFADKLFIYTSLLIIITQTNIPSELIQP